MSLLSLLCVTKSLLLVFLDLLLADLHLASHTKTLGVLL